MISGGVDLEGALRTHVTLKRREKALLPDWKDHKLAWFRDRTRLFILPTGYPHAERQ